MTTLSGIITALPTPLLDNEDVDIQSLKKLVDYVIEQGANGVSTVKHNFPQRQL